MPRILGFEEDSSSSLTLVINASHQPATTVWGSNNNTQGFIERWQLFRY